MTNKQKKDYAKLLYTMQGLNGKETAEKVGVSQKTMSQWVTKENWDELRASLTITKEQQLKRVYAMINELNTNIADREVKSRYPNSKEADTLNKLSATAKNLESETGIGEIIGAFMKFQHWLRPLDAKKAKEVTDLMDNFIQTLV